MSNPFEHQEEPLDSSLDSIEPIQESSNFFDRNDIKKFVEPPLVAACENFYDKNIRTLLSSANKKDIEIGEAYIIIDYDTLSGDNKKIAEEVGSLYFTKIGSGDKSKEARELKIVIPLDKNVTIQEIEQKAVQIADRFKKQPMLWVKNYTLEQIKELYCIPENDHSCNNPNEWEDMFFYSPEEKLFYASKEHYLKSHEEINESSEGE
jgi:hypothetical protein